MDTQVLTEFLGKSLAPYMVPSVFVHLTSLPMTGNGKVDKRALPEPKAERRQRSGREPANELERQALRHLRRGPGPGEGLRGR